jgi:hypothetical protein
LALLEKGIEKRIPPHPSRLICCLPVLNLSGRLAAAESFRGRETATPSNLGI